MKRIIIPDNWMGESIEGAMETALSTSQTQPLVSIGQPQTFQPSTAPISNKDKYIILPGATHGSYEYPEFLVAMDRTHLNEDWQQCFDGLRREEACMINLRQYVD